jgi:hypothetical protein
MVALRNSSQRHGDTFAWGDAGMSWRRDNVGIAAHGWIPAFAGMTTWDSPRASRKRRLFSSSPSRFLAGRVTSFDAQDFVSR